MAVDYLPLTFGGGIERSGGPTVVPIHFMRTAENVILGEGKVEPREGLAARADLGGSYVAMVHPSRARNEGIHVVVDTATEQASLVRTGGLGTNPTILGVWQDLILSSGRVRAIGAESGSSVFVAHDERVLSRRAHTVYYNPNQDDSTFYILQTGLDDRPDWARGGLPSDPADPDYSATDSYIRFRGVTPWLDYLVGWGFGTNATDAPEMVRISNPGEPTVFEDYAWVRAGQAGDPVVACVEIPGGLLVYKEAQTYLITGTDRSNFGIDLTDEHFGLAGPRLAVVVGNEAYGWSLQGPRRSRGGLSEDISWPLGLPWPTVEDVISSNRVRSGFAVYEPRKRHVLFVFEDWVYAFAVDTQKWAYWRMGQKVHAGAILYALTGYEGPSRGYPAYIDGSTPNKITSLFAHYRNVLAEGDEMVEVWVRPTGGAWSLYGDQWVGASPARFEVGGRNPNTQYEVAFRYLRSGIASAGYEGTDPSLWPAESRGFETTIYGAVLNLAADYDKVGTQHQVVLTWEEPAPGVSYRVLRDGAEVAVLAAGVLTWTDTWEEGTRAQVPQYEYTVEAIYPDLHVEPDSVTVDIIVPGVPVLNLGTQPTWEQEPNATHAASSAEAFRHETLPTTLEVWSEEVWVKSDGSTQVITDLSVYQSTPVASSGLIDIGYSIRYVGAINDAKIMVYVKARHVYDDGGNITFSDFTPVGSIEFNFHSNPPS